MSKIHPVILCGGSGTRLWPKSRADKPKPFLPLLGRKSLFEQTLERSANRQTFAAPTIVTGQKHLDLVEAQLSAPDAAIIVEPVGKNTAPAIALAAMRLPSDAVMLVCPSDHYIKDTNAFVAAAEMASSLAEENWLVAFGIEATQPETGYGYIKRGPEMGGGMQVDRFVEKPDLATAIGFLEDGSYSWNGGIFCFRAGLFLEELERHRPEMVAHLREAVDQAREDGRCVYPDAGHFGAIDGDSIDYAVMETTERAAMVPVTMGWSDIGNWAALHEASDSDDHGNVQHGKAELIDCSNVLVHSDGPRISAIGIKDAIIVADGDEILVTSSKGAQRVGTLQGAKSQ